MLRYATFRKKKKWFKNGFPWSCTWCHSPQHQGMEDTAVSKRIQKQLETSKIRDLATAIDGTKIKCLFDFALRRRFLHSVPADPHETRWSCAIERSWQRKWNACCQSTNASTAQYYWKTPLEERIGPLISAVDIRIKEIINWLFGLIFNPCLQRTRVFR